MCLLISDDSGIHYISARESEKYYYYFTFFSWTTTAEHRAERRVRQGALQALVNKASEGRGTASLQQSDDEKVFVWRKSIEWNECNMNMVGTDLVRHRPDNSTLFLRFLSFSAACARAQLLNTSITFPAHEMTPSLRLVTISSPFLFPPTAARKPSTVSCDMSTFARARVNENVIWDCPRRRRQLCSAQLYRNECGLCQRHSTDDGRKKKEKKSDMKFITAEWQLAIGI